ncbi:hypothetical protein OC842_005188 [Tilletia horrida]|uniref:Major facilitator superfamily (MFS) profile domain-containing protein n=1 Tax=Tilletia horrida TaxID=155126 RepID=A0AAN6GAB4_9BASI|nr:hypothetical protein OC842_005188 [Tilletia horrida]
MASHHNDERIIRWEMSGADRRGSTSGSSSLSDSTQPNRDGDVTAVNSPIATPAVTRRNSVATICMLEVVEEKPDDHHCLKEIKGPESSASYEDEKKAYPSPSSSDSDSGSIGGSEEAEKSTPASAATEQSSPSKPEEPSHGRLLPLTQFLTVYFCLALAILLTSLDQTIAACITPTISTEFGSSSQSSWIGTAFLLTSTVFQPLYGRFCDVFGRKMLFLIAQILFLGGTALCGAAPSMTALIIGRAIAGMGGAGLLSVTQIMISDIVSLRKRGVYHGILSSVNGAGSVIGPIAGGVFASKVSWRWAFYFQLPIIGFTMLCTLTVLPQVGRSDVGKFKEKFRTIDWVGIILFLSGCTLLLLAISLIAPPNRPFTSPIVCGFFFPSLALLAAFGFWEVKLAKNPVFPFKVFKAPPILAILSFNFTFGWVFFAALYFVPLWSQVANRQDAVQSSITLFPLVLTSIAFSWLSGLITSLSGNYAGTFFLGLLLTALGSILLYTLYNSDMSQGIQILTMVVLGTGFGMQMQNSLVAAQSATRQEDVAMTTAVRNFMRSIGGVLGIALSNCILYTTLPRFLSSSLDEQFPEELVTTIIDAPLEIYDLPPEFASNVPGIIAAYVRSLKIVYLVFVPISLFSLLLWPIVPEYELTRSAEGEPVRRAHRTVNVVWQARRLARWIEGRRSGGGKEAGAMTTAGEERRGSDSTLGSTTDLERGEKDTNAK